MQKYLRLQAEQKSMVDYRDVFLYFSSLTFSPTLFFILNCSEPFDTFFCQSQIESVVTHDLSVCDEMIAVYLPHQHQSYKLVE